MILSQPIYEKNAIYRPVTWYTVYQSNNLAYAEIETYVNSILVSTNFIQPAVIVPGPTNINYFIFDARKILQLNIGIPEIDNSTIFTTNLNQPFESVNIEQGKSVNINIKYYDYVNGVPTFSETEGEQPRIFCVNSCVQNGEPAGLDDYLISFGSFKKVLTRRPAGNLFTLKAESEIKSDQHLNISYFPDRFTNAAELIFYDKDNNIISTNVLKLSGVQPPIVRTIGLGLNQLVGASFITAPPVLPNREIKKYAFSLGNYGSNVYKRETLLYIVNVDYCNKGFEVHFINDLLGFESFVFDRVVTEEEEARGSFARKPLTTNFLYSPQLAQNTSDYGRFKYNNIETKKTFKCVSKDLTELEAEMLKPLIYSTEIYGIYKGDLISLVLNDSKFVTNDLNEPLVRLECTFVASVDPFAQIR